MHQQSNPTSSIFDAKSLCNLYQKTWYQHKGIQRIPLSELQYYFKIKTACDNYRIQFSFVNDNMQKSNMLMLLHEDHYVSSISSQKKCYYGDGPSQSPLC